MESQNKDSFATHITGQFVGGLGWILTIGSILIIYGYLLSTKGKLWKVLLIHGLGQLIAIFIENFFRAGQQVDKASGIRFAWIVFPDKAALIASESATVLYSYIKLEIVLTSRVYRNYLKAFLIVCFLGFAAGRVWEGLVIYNDQIFQTITQSNISAARAQSFSAAFWVAADIAILVLLLFYTIEYLQSGGLVSVLIGKLFQSSIPRLFIIILVTFGLLIVGLLDEDLKQNNENVKNVTSWLNALKCTFPLILLFDMLTTKDLLLQDSEITSTSNAFRGREKGSFTGTESTKHSFTKKSDHSFEDDLPTETIRINA